MIVMLAAGIALVGAAPAAAAVGSSTVTLTAPFSPYLIDNQVTDDEQLSVAGTTQGLAGSTIDLKCYSGAGSQTLASGVAVTAGGSFQWTGSFRGISRETCVLRAVPTGDTTDYAPGSASPYSGPVLNIGQAYQTTLSSQPNAGDLEYYYLYDSQPAGAFEYASLGGCSISESYSYDPVTYGGLSQASSESLDYCNAWFSWANGGTLAGQAPPTRSELQVDGVNAYVAGNAWAIMNGTGGGVPGYPSLSYFYSIDPATGDLSLDETDQVVRCSPGGLYPPTAATCTQFVPTGVQVTMHIVQDQNGRVAKVVQWFQSVDGAAHQVDLLENNDFYHVNSDGELDFPWTGAGMQPYTAPGQVLPGPASAGPGAFFIKGSAATPDGSEASPQGEVTFARAPSSETIVGTTNNAQHYSWIDLHYALTVPAGGSVPLGFTYSNAYQFGQVATDAVAAVASYRPTVSISSPRGGLNTAQRAVEVSGNAGDATGLSGVLVDGHPVAVAPNGAWSTTISLAPGQNTITALATNAFGNASQAQTSVVYVPPPALSALGQAHNRWRLARRPPKGGPKPTAPVGTAFSYTLNEPAQVSFAFTQQVPGRAEGRSCAAENRRNAHRRPCRRTITLGTRTVSAGAGHHRWSFGGVLPDGRRLAPGTYTVTVTATTPATGVQTTPARLRFTIVDG